jgi:hypothetical protein
MTSINNWGNIIDEADAERFVGREHELETFRQQIKRLERYKTYRQKMDAIENDPKAPQGLAAMLGRTVVRATYIVGDMVPGLRKGLEYLPRESLETQARASTGSKAPQCR